MKNDFWAIKIAALLHDPPGKVLGLADHQRRAFILMEQALGTAQFRQLFGNNGANLTRRQFESTSIGARIKKADSVASAIDRAAFPRSVEIKSEDYVRSALIRHPLSGREIPLCSVRAASGNEAALNNLSKNQQERVGDLVKGETDLYRKYLRLWRSLPEAANDAEARYLPPDTRMVDHPLWQHLDATAALATALPRPALLVFSIGPVQSFIAEARRTQDLWMGSYLLSYLTWSAIRAILIEVGPDAVLYPALRGQPLMDHWLCAEYKFNKKPDPMKLATATIPNKFVALLPADRAEAIAEQAKEEARRIWLEIAEHVRVKFSIKAQDEVWKQIWTRQVEAKDWPEIYWSILPWPDTDVCLSSEEEANAALESDEKYLGIPSPFRATFEVYKDAWPSGINSGTLYGRLYNLAQRGFDARKGLRDCLQVVEEGEKCTVSGTRSALHPNGIYTREDLRRHWIEISEELHGQNRYYEIKPDGSERLSAIVSIKRFAQRYYFESKLDLEGSFPSTSRVAAAPFYVDLFQRFDTDTELSATVKEHLDNLKNLKFPNLSKSSVKQSLPYLTARTSKNKLACQLLSYDADILFEETFNPKRLEKDYHIFATKDQANQAINSCRKLLGAAGRNPPKYYALMMLDGDEMGKWISGDNEKMPLLREAFHPNVPSLFTEEDLKNPKLNQRLQNKGEELSMHAKKWQKALNSARPMSAAVHNAISGALANFALGVVHQIVERRYPGRVVYAGGDDILAIIPAKHALAVARELRAIFSGEARIILKDDAWEVEPRFRDPNCTGFLEIGDEKLLTMGPRASASVGIALVHHMQPLDSALEAAREATRTAKETYGRNAIAVNFLRRSGERKKIGSKWFYECRIDDPLYLVEKIRMYFADGQLARGFASSFSRESLTLTALPQPAQRAELSRLLRRHLDDKLMDPQEIEDLADHLVKWANALDSQRRGPEMNEDYPSPGMVELSHWVLLARFLSQGGEE